MKEKKVFKSVITFLFILLILTGCEEKTDEVTGATWKEGIPDAPPVSVDGVLASEGRLVPVVSASGIVEGKLEGVIVSRVQGVITEVLSEIGDSVEEGDVLLKLMMRFQR